jgi:hypothetical protein
LISTQALAQALMETDTRECHLDILFNILLNKMKDV